MTDKSKGEGNREADAEYRKGVRETVESTTKDERARKARELSQDELESAREAEEEGKSHARE